MNSLISKIKRLKFNTRETKSGFSADSFDRFGDDLCEEILQYLTFEDKLKLECVSKQWSQSVFQKQHVLLLESLECKTKKYPNSLSSDKIFSCRDNQLYEAANNFTKLVTLLQKCSQINHIKITSSPHFPYEQLLRIIANNCDRVKSINCVTGINTALSENAWSYFGKKCGNYVEKLTHFHVLPFDSMLHLFPNLVYIKRIKLKQLIDSSVTLTKLKEIDGLCGCDRIDLMDMFVTKYQHSIKRLHIITGDYNNKENYETLFAQLSQLKNLEKLRLFSYDLKIAKFSTHFRVIAVNCVKLTQLILELGRNIVQISVEHITNFSCFLNSINHISRLKYLNLVFPFCNCDQSVEYNSLSLKSLSDCVKLTHLKIRGSIDDKLTDDIDKYLPQLKLIELETNVCLTDKTVNNLAKLTQLKKIDVQVSLRYVDRSRDCRFTCNGFLNLIKNCSQVRSLSLYFTDATVNMIDELIKLAITRPKIMIFAKLKPFNHRFFNIEKKLHPENLKLDVIVDSDHNQKLFIHSS